MPGPGYSFVDDEEERAALRVLRRWQEDRHAYDTTVGFPAVREFETQVSELLGAPHCVAVNSGTSALLTSLAALDIGPGDEVIVPGYMFVACLGAVTYSGATPVLAEIDESFTLSVEDVRAKITPRTRAIMAVHMLGAPCDLSGLAKLAREHGIYLIEDVAQACGGRYQGRYLGTFGDASAFSLNIYKIITSGEGGLVLTHDRRTFQRAYSFADQGWFPFRQETGEGDLVLGLNLRMPEIGAAIAGAQLAKLTKIVERATTVQEQFMSLIPARSGIRPRLAHDRAGDCGSVAGYVFERAADAAEVGRRLGVRTLKASPKHYYAGLPALRAIKSNERSPVAPFRAPARWPGEQAFRPGFLPDTDDILARSIVVSVGLSDAYLGAGFGVAVHSDKNAVEEAAQRFRKVIDDVLG